MNIRASPVRSEASSEPFPEHVKTLQSGRSLILNLPCSSDLIVRPSAHVRCLSKCSTQEIRATVFKVPTCDVLTSAP